MIDILTRYSKRYFADVIAEFRGPHFNPKSVLRPNLRMLDRPFIQIYRKYIYLRKSMDPNRGCPRSVPRLFIWKETNKSGTICNLMSFNFIRCRLSYFRSQHARSPNSIHFILCSGHFPWHDGSTMCWIHYGVSYKDFACVTLTHHTTHERDPIRTFLFPFDFAWRRSLVVCWLVGQCRSHISYHSFF